MHNLEFKYDERGLSIIYRKEDGYYHKEIINVDEKKFKNKGEKISKEIKHIKGFQRYGAGFGTIDWYDDDECGFNVPYVLCDDSTNGKLKMGMDYCDTIPKDWYEYHALTMDNPTSIRGINKYLKVLKLDLDNKQLNQIRKSMKDKKAFTIEFEED